jgi:putative ABC transport system permease protein
VRVLNRKLRRDLRTSKGQAVAVMAVILLGVASFVSMMACHRNLRLTQEAYYERYRLADFWVPVERAPAGAVRDLEALPGLLRAQGRLVKDVTLDVPGVREPITGRLISLPVGANLPINDVHLVTGRPLSPGVRNEVIVNDRFARGNRLTVGDRLWATMNDRKQPLVIVGTALSPEYIYAIRDPRDLLPNPARFGILWVSTDFAEMALDLQQARNEFVGFIDPHADPKAVADRIERLLKPYGAVTVILRKDQLSNFFLSNEIDQLRQSAQVVPPVFLGIAAMVLLIMLDRIVQRDRTEIGVFKACGYATWEMGWHYLKFAALVAGCGGLLGALGGHWLAGVFMGMYVQIFEFPILRHGMYPDLVAGALLLSLTAGAAGATFALARVVRIQPALAMRPAAPKPGRRVLLERFAFLWRRIDFTGKTVIRNLSRYRVRSAVTVFGIICATAILLMGGFYKDCVDLMLANQFEVLERQDMTLSLQTERGTGALYEAQRLPGVRRAEPVLNYPFTLESAWRSKDVMITGVEPTGRLMGLVDLAGRPIDVGERGLVLDEHLAETLGVQPGDVLTATPLRGRVTRAAQVPVHAVVQQYIGEGAYMNLRAVSRLLDEPYALNAVLLAVEPGAEAALDRRLKDLPAVAAVGRKRETQRQIEATMVQSLLSTILVFTVFAGVIAFAIIYNSTVISLGERVRELASLRVLGFRLGEIERLVYDENAILSAAGVAVGLPVGALLCRAMVKAFEVAQFRMPFVIYPRTYVIVAAVMALFVLIANLAVRRRIHRLNMVEVLKARE